MKITFKDKSIEVEEVCEGVVKKTDSVFYIMDHNSNEWKYCSKQRLDQLVKRYTSLKYVGLEYKSSRSSGKPRSPKGDKVISKNTMKDVDGTWLWVSPELREKDYAGKF